jgi:hypothetical protein
LFIVQTFAKLAASVTPKESANAGFWHTLVNDEEFSITKYAVHTIGKWREMVDEGLDGESLFESFITSFYSDFHQERRYGIESLHQRHLNMMENQLRAICWRCIFHEHRPHGIFAGWFSSAGDDAS